MFKLLAISALLSTTELNNSGQNLCGQVLAYDEPGMGDDMWFEPLPKSPGFIYEEGQVRGISKQEKLKRCLKALKKAWDDLIYHCDESDYYAEKISNQKISDSVSEAIATGLATLYATKNHKLSIVTSLCEFVSKYSFLKCYYMGRTLYHLREAEKCAKLWDKIFDYMIEEELI